MNPIIEVTTKYLYERLTTLYPNVSFKIGERFKLPFLKFYGENKLIGFKLQWNVSDIKHFNKYYIVSNDKLIASYVFYIEILNDKIKLWFPQIGAGLEKDDILLSNPDALDLVLDKCKDRIANINNDGYPIDISKL